MPLENKHKVMLAILVILLVARFMVVPVIDWQNEKIAEINAKEKRLNKAENVISRLSEFKANLTNVKADNIDKQSKFYNAKSLNALKLELQQQIERLFAQHNVKINRFTWAAEVEGEIVEERAKITFGGETADIAKLQFTIAQFPKLLNVVQWTMHFKKVKDNSLGTATGTIVISAYSIMPS